MRHTLVVPLLLQVLLKVKIICTHQFLNEAKQFVKIEKMLYTVVLLKKTSARAPTFERLLQCITYEIINNTDYFHTSAVPSTLPVAMRGSVA